MASFCKRTPNSALTLAAAALTLVFTPSPGLSFEMSSPTHRIVGGSFSAGAASRLDTVRGQGVGNGSAVVGEGLAGATSSPSGATLAGGFSTIAAQTVICGNGTVDPGEACDDGGTIPGDGCWATCQSENALAFSGIAVGGFAIEFTVNGVPLLLVTLPRESSADLAQRVADLINDRVQDADALAIDDRLITNGMLSNTVSNDPGISLGGAQQVPGLSAWGLVLLASLLGWVPMLVGRNARRRGVGSPASHG